MIPKTIHYCWFGGNEMPPEYKKYIQSWKKYLPDFNIVCHDESNFEFDCDYVREAHTAGKWAFVSDYARIKIIYELGGVYLDTDVELLKPLFPILKNGPFMAIERKLDDIGVNLGLGFAAPKGDPLLFECLCDYRTAHFINSNGSYDMTTVVERVTAVLDRHGFKREDEFQAVGGMTVYPSEYFDPIDCATGKRRFTDNTHAVHHYAASWISGRLKLKNKLKRLLGARLTSGIIKLKRGKK